MKYLYITTDPSTLNLESFIQKHQLFDINGKVFTPKALLVTKNETGTTNLELIRSLYDDLDAEFYSGAEETFVKPGTQLIVPVWCFRADFARIQGSFVFNRTDYPVFVKEEVKKLTQESRFVKRDDGGDSHLSRSIPQCRVWVYTKTLNKIIDISPFIISANIFSGANGGNFQITLPAVTATITDTGFALDDTSAKFYFNEGTLNYYSKSTLADREGKRNPLLFHHLIKPNDIIFIAFEPLFGEKRTPVGSFDFGSLEVPLHQLATEIVATARDPKKREVDDTADTNYLQRQRCWDMIGLVDRNTVSTNFSTSDTSILISGRDLYKTILTDGDYAIFPDDEHDLQVPALFSNQRDSNPRVARRLDGKRLDLSVNVDLTVQSAVSYVFSLLSHIQVCPDEVFISYNQYRSQYFYPTKFNADRTAVLEGEMQNGAGIWSIIKVVVDDSLQDRRLVDSTFADSDSDLSAYLQKIVQPPFAEIVADTIGGFYYFSFRRPPFARQQWKELVALSDELEDFHLSDDKILSEELSFDDEQAYSWYQLNPLAFLFGASYKMAYLPPVFFPEFAEVFGNRPLEVTTNYIHHRNLKNDGAFETNYLQEQAAADLAWLIETHAYLPFTRKGTITLIGDRRIKKGMAIRLPATSEVFYVDAVSHSFSISEDIERTTVLQVSRGMVDKRLPSGKSTLDLYFDLIDFGKEPEHLPDREQHPKTETGKPSRKPAWQVNKEIFQFFLQSKQFQNR